MSCDGSVGLVYERVVLLCSYRGSGGLSVFSGARHGRFELFHLCPLFLCIDFKATLLLTWLCHLISKACDMTQHDTTRRAASRRDASQVSLAFVVYRSPSRSG